MKRTFRLLKFSQHSAAENMAIDEAIFRLYTDSKQDTIRFYSWNPSAVSIGKHQSIDEEINLENIKKLGFDYVRRITGGGSVFHDENGELTYSVITNNKYLTSKVLDASYYELAHMVFHPIEKLGLDFDYNKIHCPSIFTGGKKISGNAQARSGDTILQHGTLLINYRPEIMYSVLKARPNRDTKSMIKSVYQHVTTLSEKLNKDLDPSQVAHYLQKELLDSELIECFYGELTSNEKQLANRLLIEKYKSGDWLLSG
ncbi:MAG: biotin/lipoate A/B protein ligase family protein [Candidatus Hodarchaeota archaeon]